MSEDVERAERLTWAKIVGLKWNLPDHVTDDLAALVAEEIARLQERLDAHADIVAKAVAAERERVVSIALGWVSREVLEAALVLPRPQPKET